MASPGRGRAMTSYCAAILVRSSPPRSSIGASSVGIAGQSSQAWRGSDLFDFVVLHERDRTKRTLPKREKEWNCQCSKRCSN